MTALYLIFAACPVLLVMAVAFLVLIVVGIHRGDRGDLSAPTRNRIDTITRRVTGLAVRNSASNKGGEG